MQLTTSWQLLATGTGALVQVHGSTPVALAYHTTTPTTQDTFGLGHNQPLLLPTVAGKNLYGKTMTGTANMSVEAG